MVAAVGVSGSGKTTVIEYLISKLSAEGYKVGAIKHIHREGFTIDKEGTNTWRFTNAGSRVTVAISPEEIAIIKRTPTSETDLDRVVELLNQEHLDIIFIEGFHGTIAKRSDVLKIVTAKTSDDLNRTLSETVEPILGITGLAAQGRLKKEKLQVFNIPLDGDKILEAIKRYLK